jgi:hypothetical protein
MATGNSGHRGWEATGGGWPLGDGRPPGMGGHLGRPPGQAATGNGQEGFLMMLFLLFTLSYTIVCPPPPSCYYGCPGAKSCPWMRNNVICTIKNYLVPKAQTAKGKGGLLPSVGIILDNDRLCRRPVCCRRPNSWLQTYQSRQQWLKHFAPMLQSANFKVDRSLTTVLNVVLIRHGHLSQGAVMVYNKIRDMVNGYNTHFWLGDRLGDRLYGGLGWN